MSGDEYYVKQSRSLKKTWYLVFGKNGKSIFQNWTMCGNKTLWILYKINCRIQIWGISNFW